MLFQKRAPQLLILLVSLIAVVALTSCDATATETAAAADEPVQTAALRTGDISISATGAGTVIPAT